MNKILVVVTAFAFACGAFNFILYQQNQLGAYHEINTQNQPTIGSASASIHVVSFQDFKCSGCKYFNDEIYPRLKKAYIDTGKIRFTLIPIAFLPGSDQIAEAAICVYQLDPSRFFPYVDELFQAYSWEYPEWSSHQNLITYAKVIGGVDIYRLRRQMQTPETERVLKSNYQMAKELMGRKLATPAVFVNGYELKSFTYGNLALNIEKILMEKEHGVY